MRSSPIPVSVIIPAYNRAELLPRCLTSIGMQHPAAPAEVIVIDDGSRDRTSEVAEELGAKVIRHPQNRGLSVVRNTGLQAASHEWVALLDSDDEWLPRHLAHLWQLREGHVLVAGSSLECGTDPSAYRFRGAVRRKPMIIDSGDQLISMGNPIPTSGSLFRRDLALQVGGFQAHRGVVEDFDMWLRLLELGSAICSPEVTVIYHVHDAQISRDAEKMELATFEAAEAHRRRTSGSRSPLLRLEGATAWDRMRASLREGDRDETLRWARRLLAHPQRIVGLMNLLIARRRIHRRGASLRAAGVGPSGDAGRTIAAA